MRNFDRNKLLGLLAYFIIQVPILVLAFAYTPSFPENPQHFTSISSWAGGITLVLVAAGFGAAWLVKRMTQSVGFFPDLEPAKLQMVILVICLLNQNIPGIPGAIALRAMIIVALVYIGLMIGVFRSDSRADQGLAHAMLTVCIAVYFLIAPHVVNSGYYFAAAIPIALVFGMAPGFISRRLGGFESESFEDDLQAFEQAEEDIDKNHVLENGELVIWEAFGRGLVTCYFTFQELASGNVPEQIRKNGTTSTGKAVEGEVDLSNWLIINDPEHEWLVELAISLGGFVLAQRGLSLAEGGDLEPVFCSVGTKSNDLAARATNFDQLPQYVELLTSAKQKATQSQTLPVAPPQASPRSNGSSGRRNLVR